MSLQPDHRQHVRRLLLPSGKSVDVVYFEAAGTDADTPAPRLRELHVCGPCAAELVYPIEWTEEGSAHWRVTLRCPNCLWTGTGVFTQDEVERFDEELDRATECMVRDLERLSTTNMSGEIEGFVTALRHDHVLPSDF